MKEIDETSRKLWSNIPINIGGRIYITKYVCSNVLDSKPEVEVTMSLKEIKLRPIQEILHKIRELSCADLDQMVFEEVEYGKFWLKWVLGEEEHETKMSEE